MKKRNVFLSFILGTILLTACMGFAPEKKSAPAAESIDEVVQPTGLFTNLSLSINCGMGEVWATVKNSFTLFPATVTVYVELYNSTEFEESYKDMNFVGREFIQDLNINQTLQISAPTKGEMRYWQARMYFKVDRRDWQEKMTSTVLIDGDGNYIRG